MQRAAAVSYLCQRQNPRAKSWKKRLAKLLIFAVNLMPQSRDFLISEMGRSLRRPQCAFTFSAFSAAMPQKCKCESEYESEGSFVFLRGTQRAYGKTIWPDA